MRLNYTLLKLQKTTIKVYIIIMRAYYKLFFNSFFILNYQAWTILWQCGYQPLSRNVELQLCTIIYNNHFNQEMYLSLDTDFL